MISVSSPSQGLIYFFFPLDLSLFRLAKEEMARRKGEERARREEEAQQQAEERKLKEEEETRMAEERLQQEREEAERAQKQVGGMRAVTMKKALGELKPSSPSSAGGGRISAEGGDGETEAGEGEALPERGGRAAGKEEGEARARAFKRLSN